MKWPFSWLFESQVHDPFDCIEVIPVSGAAVVRFLQALKMRRKL